MALIDADYFNANMVQLGLKSTWAPKDEVLDQLILDASDWVANYTRRVIEPTTITEVVKGKGYNRLILDHWPIISVSSVVFDEDTHTPDLNEVDLDDIRALSNGMLEWKHPFSDGPWRTSRTYTVTYSAGYEPIPNAIKRATAFKVVDLFQPMYQGARDQRLVEFIVGIEEQIVDLLEPYRRERIG